MLLGPNINPSLVLGVCVCVCCWLGTGNVCSSSGWIVTSSSSADCIIQTHPLLALRERRRLTRLPASSRTEALWQPSVGQGKIENVLMRKVFYFSLLTFQLVIALAAEEGCGALYRVYRKLMDSWNAPEQVWNSSSFEA